MDRSGNSGGSAARPTLGVYVHFPWCLKKCPYCDFASYPAAREVIPHAGYADALLAELEVRRPDIGDDATLATVFFGGGTPSLWEPEELGRALAGVRGSFTSVAPELEVTVECNPTSLDEDRASRLREVGVNRLSVGVQSLDPGRLAFLGRLHDVEGGLRAVRAALAAGFDRVSADLIYGVEGGTPESPEAAAREVARLVDETGVRHLSAYGLTIEPGTAFGELHRKGRLPVASDDVLADSFFAIDEALGARGLAHYEVSNYAAPGEESRHNLGYWRGDDYLGLGCGAVGTLSDRDGGTAARYRNHPDPGRYMRGAAARSLAVLERESLDPKTRLRERIMLGLRLDAGFDLGAAEEALGLAPDPERTRVIDGLVRAGKLERDGRRLRIPKRARAFTDGIAAALF